ncbi:MAG: hypothetical protein JWQ68_552 [Cryobacterium sp.]|nr:hypothetical protein [Cryobacterium sp.]
MRFLILWHRYPLPLLGMLAWALIIAASLATAIIVERRLKSTPRRAFLIAMTLGTVIAVLDLVGSFGPDDPDAYPTAAAAVGALIMAFAPVRETRDLVLASAALAALMTAFALAEGRPDPTTLAPEILTIAIGTVPPLVAAAIVRSFRRMVQLELDLVLVQSTVSQPRFAVGMLASEELARLDLGAEQLLDDVAEERVSLPLSPARANTAASLATQLRLHLIEGRTETWLHHAVTESEFLGPSVQVNDPSGLAGLLTPAQRDALLLTIWLLVSGDTPSDAAVVLAIGPISPASNGAARRKVRFPIEIMTTGVPRRRVDPETWQAIRVVGPHVDSIRDGSLRVHIECSVDNPADA